MADNEPFTPSADLREFEQKARHMKFKYPPPKLPMRRKSSVSVCSDGSSSAMSYSPSPCPSPHPIHFGAEEKEVSQNENKSSDSKETTNDSSSSDSGVVILSPEVQSSIDTKPEEAQKAEVREDIAEDWEDRHYRSPYLEDMASRWRSGYATAVPNPVVLEYVGRPNIPKDSRRECDMWAPSRMSRYLIERMPEEILNGTPIDQWDSSASLIPKARRRKRKMSWSPESGNQPTIFHTYSYGSSAIDDADFDPNEPLFAEETKPLGMDEDCEQLIAKSLNAEDLLFSNDTPDSDRYNEPIFKEEPPTSQAMRVNAVVVEKQIVELGNDAGEEALGPGLILMFPGYLSDRSPPRQMERDLLAVLCALCDIQSCNVSRSTWFAVLLRKAEQTLQQLTAIENRRRKELEVASGTRNHLKNRIAILAAKKRSFDEANEAGIPIRMGAERTLAEGRLPPAIANAISMKPSDSNASRAIPRNYQIRNGIASPVLQHHPGSHMTIAPRPIDQRLSPYHLMNQRRAALNGIPAAALLAEPGQPIRQAYNPVPRYNISPAVRRPLIIGRPPQVATVRFPQGPLQPPHLQPQGHIRQQPPPRDSPQRFFVHRPS